MEDEEVKLETAYFFDSYAIIEILKENPKYRRFIMEPVTLTIFNLAEIYYSILNDYSGEKADKVYEVYKKAVVEISEEILKEAMKFRKKNKKRDLSYADCIGYIYSIKNNLIFLTGDKEFKELDNVEFVGK
ncbi:PIN domain-containing protein [Candidatus Pacearchaeota archaeon]|nr:PIN domain-containing protein [Candidatus Pacearchaeota archaeon]MBI2056986.1 PIN domain-containing protein [Candidatus Pacearchaeota archaeon]